MLILTRRVGESVRIEDEVFCKILELRPHFVRLGFDAPLNIPIYREEIYDVIQKKKGINTMQGYIFN